MGTLGGFMRAYRVLGDRRRFGGVIRGFGAFGGGL